MKIGIIGANGFLGSILCFDLAKHFDEVISITRENYSSCLGTYDVIINANGNSKKYWANNNPIEDFEASTVSVYKSIFDFPCKKYIFISTVDVYNQSALLSTAESTQIDSTLLHPYGFNKFLAETIVKKYTKNFLILRSSAIVGEGLRKGVVHDIISGNELFVVKESCIQCISCTAIASIINMLLKIDDTNTIINVGGIGTTSVEYMADLLKINPMISLEAKYQYYEMNVNKLKNLFSLKTSNYYVKEVLNERME